jgi:flagellin
MGLRIGTNMASISAQRYLGKSEAMVTHASRALASGTRLVNAGDDAAGFAIAESLRGQASSLKQAHQNAENAGGLMQVAEGGLSEQNNILVRLRELAVQAASDTVGEDERGFLNTEFTSLVSEFDRIAQTTTYGHKKLLTGTDENLEFQLGANNTENDVVKYKFDTNTTASKVGIKGLDVSDKGDAKDALSTIDDAQTVVARARAGFGAMQERLQIAANNVDVQKENILEARSRIADTDIAEETSNLAQGRILEDVGTAVLAQANQNSERALKLLG